MGTSSYDSIFGLGTTNIVVPPGATLAVYMAPISGQNTTVLKYVSGGSLQIIGVPHGVTLTPAQLVSAVGNHYMFDLNEALSFDGPITCYLQALGSTTIVMSIRGKTQET